LARTCNPKSPDLGFFCETLADIHKYVNIIKSMNCFFSFSMRAGLFAGLPSKIVVAPCLLGLGLVTSAGVSDSHGVDLSTLDRSVSAPDNFYQFANGGWLAKAKIPNDEPAEGAFHELSERSEATVLGILDHLASDHTLKPGTIERKIADFYRTALDDERADRLGAAPILGLLKECDEVSDPGSAILVSAKLSNLGVSSFFSDGIEADPTSSNRKMYMLAQGGIGLPDRDYYLNDDPTSKFLRQMYQAHISRTLELLGQEKKAAQTAAEHIFALETRLAKASRTSVQMRDVRSLVHRQSVASLAASSKVIPWKAYFAAVDLPSLAEVNNATPEFFKGLESALLETPPSDLKLYLRWRVMSVFSSALGKSFRDEDFRFSSAFTGQKEQSPKWRRALQATEVLGFAVGKLYVAKVFPATAKAKAKSLILALKESFRHRLATNPWMSASTKAEALRKLDKVMIKVGYPDRWESYEGLEVGTDSLADNLIRAAKFAHAKSVREFGKPVDRTKWQMTPQTVNAYYNPQNNEIVFPAAILQPPFFDPAADDASNFGGIGSVIGHEMSHGFDDQGRTFDANGNLRDWWTAEDATKFKALTDRLAAQYSQYTAVGNVKVNGQLTTGENVADLGGIHVAYDALEARPAGKKVAPIGGFTPEQRFFIAFAQIWRFKTTPQFAELLAKIDAHSPNPVRVSGTLVNVPEFVKAFGVPSGKGDAVPGSGTLRIW
jgi:putative endopeptidase